MYNPQVFSEQRLEVLYDAIDRIGLATLITTTADGLVASHVPMLLNRNEGAFGTLYGHIALANLQWRDSLPNPDALAIFLGPDAYISPSWYPAKAEHGRVVPTWNYLAVHAYGAITFFQDPERLLRIVTLLTDRHEAGSAEPWQVADAPPNFIEGQLKAIVGFQLPLRRIEGKWKMSQNRSAEDRRGVVHALGQRGHAGDSEVAALVAERVSNP